MLLVGQPAAEVVLQGMPVLRRGKRAWRVCCLPPRRPAEEGLLPAVLDAGQPGGQGPGHRAGAVPARDRAPSAQLRRHAALGDPRARAPGGQARTATASPGPSRRHRPAPSPGWIQLKLFDARKDYTRFGRSRHADLASPWLARARTAAQAIGEARGWTRWVASDVDRGLVILLSGHEGQGDKVRYSEMFPALRAHGISAERTAEILSKLGLLRDNRVPAFETWLERHLASLASASGPTSSTGSGPCGTAARGHAPAIPRQPGPTCTRSPR